jgi:hypothetical protein
LKTSFSDISDHIELRQGPVEGSTLLSVPVNENDKQEVFKKTYEAQENTTASLEEVYWKRFLELK